jgi:hypothetical protein
MTALTMTAASSLTIRILPNGETRMSSTDPWHRYLCALVDLYLSGRISEDTLQDQAVAWSQGVLDSGDQAARRLLTFIFQPSDEGSDDYRERLVHILTGVIP